MPSLFVKKSMSWAMLGKKNRKEKETSSSEAIPTLTTKTTTASSSSSSNSADTTTGAFQEVGKKNIASSMRQQQATKGPVNGFVSSGEVNLKREGPPVAASSFHSTSDQEQHSSDDTLATIPKSSMSTWDVVTASSTPSSPMLSIEDSKALRERLLKKLREMALDCLDPETNMLQDERRSMHPKVLSTLSGLGLPGGLFGPTLMEGGQGLRWRDTAKIVAQLGAIDVSLAIFVGNASVLGTLPIIRFGSPLAKKNIVPRLLRGPSIAAFAITEYSSGSSFETAVSGTARPVSGTNEEEWIINAEKMWVGNAGMADYCVIFLRQLNENGESTSNMVVFWVDLNSKGVKIGREWMTAGLKTMVQNSVTFTNVKVTKSMNMLTGLPPREMIDATLQVSRWGMQGVAVGIIKRSLQLATRFATRREIFSGRLIDNAITLDTITEMSYICQILESWVDGLAERMDRLDGNVDYELTIAIKFWGAELTGWVADKLIQVMGSRGFCENNIASRIWRDVRVFRIFEGATEPLRIYLGHLFFNKPTSLTSMFPHAPHLIQPLQSLVSRMSDFATNVLRPKKFNNSPANTTEHLHYHVGDLIAWHMALGWVSFNPLQLPQPRVETLQTWVSAKINSLTTAFFHVGHESLMTPLDSAAFLQNLAADFEMDIGDLGRHPEPELRPLGALPGRTVVELDSYLLPGPVPYFLDKPQTDANAAHVLRQMGVKFAHIGLEDKETDESWADFDGGEALRRFCDREGFGNEHRVKVVLKDGTLWNSINLEFPSIQAALDYAMLEHKHDLEPEGFYVHDGAIYFDIRSPLDDRWIRCELGRGDVIVVPAGHYHRFNATPSLYAVYSEISFRSSRFDRPVDGAAALTDQFDRACLSLGSVLSSLNTKQKLEFYGLFKQAKEGDCSLPSPKLTEADKIAKWKAWSKLKGMEKEDAMREYVKMSGHSTPPTDRLLTIRNLTCLSVRTQGVLITKGLRINMDLLPPPPSTETPAQDHLPLLTHAPNTVTTEGDSLVVWRNTTSTRLLDTDSDEDRETSLFAFVRVLITFVTLTAFILITSPKSNLRDGFSLDSTVNVTVLSATTLNGTAKAGGAIKFPKLMTPGNILGGTVSVLGVPALFGREFEDGPVLAPIVILEDVDACHPFQVSLPNVLLDPEYQQFQQSADAALHGEHRQHQQQPQPQTQKHPQPAQQQQLLQHQPKAQLERKVQQENPILTSHHHHHRPRNAPLPPLPLPSAIAPTPSDPSSSASSSALNGPLVLSATDANLASPPHTTTATPNSDPLLLSNWYALVPRGRCPFDVKVFNAQSAGLAGAIIYNNGTSVGNVDLPVRMSANTLGSAIVNAQGMFVTHKDGMELLKSASVASAALNASSDDGMTGLGVSPPLPPPFLSTPAKALLVSLTLADWPSAGWGTPTPLPPTHRFTLFSLLFDLFFLTTASILFGAICTLLCVGVGMVRNYWIHGQWFVVIAAPSYLFFNVNDPHGVGEDGLDMGNARKGEESVSMLERVTLKLKVITKEDLEDPPADACVCGSGGCSAEGAESGAGCGAGRVKGGSRDCCAICIDEFVIGSRVRELPCLHRFHDVCIDPWLTKHTRLCPICKRDVLTMPSNTTSSPTKSPTAPTPTSDPTQPLLSPTSHFSSSGSSSSGNSTNPQRASYASMASTSPPTLQRGLTMEMEEGQLVHAGQDGNENDQEGDGESENLNGNQQGAEDPGRRRRGWGVGADGRGVLGDWIVFWRS
ncbi:hypothetical protein HDV05_003409 [Chytridiales sp. JEL 0842]|nr:hypothetical protein HDV05_003409 [Chytridiales sp. JEL 0842]